MRCPPPSFAVAAAIVACGAAAAQDAAQTLPPTTAAADEQPFVRASRDDLVRAARDDAADRLYQAVSAEFVAPGLTVGGMLQRLDNGAAGRVRRALEDVPQHGGPRFAAPGTAEVQLQGGGEFVASILRGELRRDGAAGRLPENVTVDQIERVLRRWTGRNFGAIGRSVTPDLVIGALARDTSDTDASIEPLADETGWLSLSEEARQRAFVEARREVVERVIAAARPVPLAVDADAPAPATASTAAPAAASATLGDLLDFEAIGVQSRRWLAARPVTRIAVDGRQLRVTLALDAAEWVARLRADLEAAGDAPPLDDRQWAEIIPRLAAVMPDDLTGVAVADAPEDLLPRVNDAASSPLAAALRPLVDPTDAAAVVPQWSRQLIAASGSADYGFAADEADWQKSRKRLVAARAAERNAREAVVVALRELPLGGDATVGSVADAHPPTALLVAAAAEAASVQPTLYDDAAGTVTVTLTADGPTLWQNLASLGGN